MVPGRLGCGSAVLAATTIRAPSRAAFSAISLPMPRLAPVMNRTRPASFLSNGVLCQLTWQAQGIGRANQLVCWGHHLCMLHLSEKTRIGYRRSSWAGRAFPLQLKRWSPCISGARLRIRFLTERTGFRIGDLVDTWVALWRHFASKIFQWNRTPDVVEQ